jgi:hypothetical protein
LQFGDVGFLKDTGEQCEIGTIVFERKLELVTEVLARPIFGRVSLGRQAGRGIDDPRRPFANERLMPIRNDI